MKKIQLWKNRNELSDSYAMVDDEDYDRIMEAIRSKKTGMPGKWYVHASDGKGGEYEYAVSGGRRLGMHRVVMNAPKGMDVDHKNGDRLNNCKENLRICTRAENSRNKRTRSDSASGIKGVYYVKNPGYENFLKNGPTLKKDGTPRKNQPQPLAKPYYAHMGDPDRPGYDIKLGYYATAEEAGNVAAAAREARDGEFYKPES